jgi:N-acetylneuraminate synthase
MTSITVNDREVGKGCRTYIVAEMSANHAQSLDRAVKIVEAAKKAGADAIKLQTYTPDTITLDSDTEYFRISGTSWDGRTLYDLYSEAYTPWEWHPILKKIADDLGLHFFSAAFDPTSVDFLESINVPAYKVASPEIVDLPLLQRIAATRKPIILSTGMATLSEIDTAVRTLRGAGADQLALLKCVSAYPAPAEEMHLLTIPHLAESFGAPVGLSDHTLGIEVSIAAVALGASIIEKHLTLSRKDGCLDSEFSLEPNEFGAMVSAVRRVESAIGSVRYGPSDHETVARRYRRSLFIVEDVEEGEVLTERNVRSIRPAQGLPPVYLNKVIGRRVRRKLVRGTPLNWDMIE